MKRLLTLATGGLFAAMAVLPVAAFADNAAAPAKDAKVPSVTTTQTVAPTTETKGHKAETKTEAKADTTKHDGAVKTPDGHASSVQPKPVEPGKS
jgi:spermidine/putrescine-binding protein